MEQQLLRSMVSRSPLPSAETAKLLGMSDREYQEFSAWIVEIQATTTGE
jgi:hypothetical protein